MATWNSPLKTRCSALIIAFLLTLGGCGGGESDGGSSVTPPPAGTNPPPSGGTPPPSGGTTENHVTGSVGDGPIVGARLRVFARNGALLTETTSGDTADYDLVITTQDNNYALTLQADRGIDLVTGGTPDFRLVSAISRPSTRTISNLNPFSTLIYETARRNGGISDSSVSAARHAVTTRYGFGLDTALLADPVTTPITGDNVAMVVKTSETLGEMIRRTRDAMNATGQNLNGDAVVAALSADLVDGWLDGMGAYESNSRLAAVANVASAAVLVEAMSNALRVYGNNATDAMDLSIRQVRPDAPQFASTRNVTIPATTFRQAARVLRAAQIVDPDPVIAATLEVIETAEADLEPEILAARLPSGSRGALRRATTSTAYASDDVIRAVNAQARGNSSTDPEPDPDPTPPPPDPDPDPTPPPPDPDPEPDPDPTPPPPANNPPVISGSPNTALVVGTPWSFTPTASDPDGDSLTFSVAGAPNWMYFNSSTGRLYGTPSSANVGTYTNIRISVSDGQATTTLPAFSLTVTEPQPSTGAATVSWTPPTERVDGSPIGTISSYRIYYGRNSAQLDQAVNVSGGLTSFHIDNLVQGTWYFSVTATCADGLESARSAMVSKTIP